MEGLQELKLKLVERDGVENQVICCIEEMSEATKVMTKFLRGSTKFSKENLAEEIAHSMLMLETVKNIFGIEDSEIEENQLDALKRCFDLD